MRWQLWIAQVEILLGADFKRVSETLLRIAFDQGDNPAIACRWARVALSGQGAPAGVEGRQG